MNEPKPSIARVIWDQLLRGTLRLARSAEPGSSLCLVPAPAPTWTARRARRLAACAAVLRGQAQKALAVDLGVAPATLAGLLQDALLDLGVDSRCTRVPIALPLLLHAAESPRVVVLAEVGVGALTERGGHVSLSFPTHVLAKRLSAAEHRVALAYLEGQPQTEIASARGTSTRTVANQLSSTFQKLGVSGRFSLLSSIVDSAAQQGAPLVLTVRSVAPERPACEEEERAPVSTTFPARALSA